ncbi:MAG: HPr family phosphocarrier protein [Burkholderiales bacterium]|nr:HPr family phosphocarrier protein [Burkholderiales bacterium]
MKTITVTVTNKLGLHARPAAKLTQKANEFLSSLTMSNGKRNVNGKSIMGVMLMAAAQGTQLQVTADGTDEDDLLKAIKELFETKFGEKE